MKNCYFFDTSALVKLYVEEPGSARLLELTEDPETYDAAVVEIARLEFRSAVRRREREGTVASVVVDEILTQLDSDLQAHFLVQPISSSLLASGVALIDRHHLRAYDALQLAGCLSLTRSVPDWKRAQFITSDKSLLQAARDEGLMAIDPTTD